MEKALTALFLLIAIFFAPRAFAVSRCQYLSPNSTERFFEPFPAMPMSSNKVHKIPCNPCYCDDWLNNDAIEEYFCRMGFNAWQREQSRNVINKFRQNMVFYRLPDRRFEKKCDCRAYIRALRWLDCQMKCIITQCQKSDYILVRKEIKERVKCCHNCLIWPFYSCKRYYKYNCGCECNSNSCY